MCNSLIDDLNSLSLEELEEVKQAIETILYSERGDFDED